MKEGPNRVTFSGTHASTRARMRRIADVACPRVVRTGLRGIQTVSCMLYLWRPGAVGVSDVPPVRSRARRPDVPIVISDIDGTITRSDIPGMFLPYVGRDWSQIGGALSRVPALQWPPD